MFCESGMSVGCASVDVKTNTLFTWWDRSTEWTLFVRSDIRSKLLNLSHPKSDRTSVFTCEHCWIRRLVRVCVRLPGVNQTIDGQLPGIKILLVTLMLYVNLIMEWSEEDEALLVANVEIAPVMWQPTHPSYGRRGPRESLLKKAAKIFYGHGVMCFWCDRKSLRVGSGMS